MSFQLSPVQRAAFEAAHAALAIEHVISVNTGESLGRTGVLRALQQATNGTLLGAREFLEATTDAHPLAMEEQLHALVTRTLGTSDCVLIDSFQLYLMSMTGCQAYPRTGYINSVIASLGGLAEAAGKRLVFGADPRTAMSYLFMYARVNIADFGPDDYAHVCAAYLPASTTTRLDFARIHRYAPKLSPRQLRRTSQALASIGDTATTEEFLAHVDRNHLLSNVRLGEVQDVELNDLRGMESVIDALDAAVVFPLENPKATAEFSLRPKRGVLLAGPPGTGKTTIGRALARKLRGKFFLVDGTMISGSRDFYDRLKRLFELAKRNAPAVIFIDDSDVIFESGQDTGFYRYLLTMLDGLESESPGQVCVMMTAMDVGSLPPALVRSGRIELWLETKLPDAPARAQILQDHAATLPASVGTVDIARLTEATDGLSGADLKRTVADGKLRYAYDQSRGVELRTITEYMVGALQTVLANREHYAAAVARAAIPRVSRQRPGGPSA